MDNVLPGDIKVDETSDTRRLILPPLKFGPVGLGAMVLIPLGTILACVGFIWLVVLAVMLNAPMMGRFPGLLAVPLLFMMTGTALAFHWAVLWKGRKEVVVDEKYLTVIERIGPIRWSSRRRRNGIIRFNVVDFTINRTNAAKSTHPSWALRAECATARPLVITRFYPHDWSIALAAGLSRLCLDRRAADTVWQDASDENGRNASLMAEGWLGRTLTSPWTWATVAVAVALVNVDLVCLVDTWSLVLKNRRPAGPGLQIRDFIFPLILVPVHLLLAGVVFWIRREQKLIKRGYSLVPTSPPADPVSTADPTVGEEISTANWNAVRDGGIVTLGRFRSNLEGTPHWGVVRDDGIVARIDESRRWIAWPAFKAYVVAALIVAIPNAVLVGIFNVIRAGVFNQKAGLWNSPVWVWLPIPCAGIAAASFLINWVRGWVRKGALIVDRSNNTLTISSDTRQEGPVTIPWSSVAAIEVEPYSSGPPGKPLFATVVVLRRSGRDTTRMILDYSDQAHANWLAGWLRNHIRS